MSRGYDVAAIPYDYTIEEPANPLKVADNLKILKEQFKYLQPEYMNNPFVFCFCFSFFVGVIVV